MSPEFIEVLTLVYRGLIGIGALASVWFFFDYIQTANLNSPYSKMLLTLNGAIGIILSISFIRAFASVDMWVNFLTLFAFVLVDAMLIFQIYLLHKSRKN